MNKLRFFLSQSDSMKKIAKFLQFLIKKLFSLSARSADKLSTNLELLLEVEGLSGYYDKKVLCDFSGQLVIGRSHSDQFDIFLVDLRTGKETFLTSSTAWNYQQGAMVEWFCEGKIIYNDFVKQTLCSIILDVNTSERQIIKNFPIQTKLGYKNEYLSINYNRLSKLRPDYGYTRYSKWHLNLVDENDGIWLIDNEFNNRLLISISDLKEVMNLEGNVQCKINHISSNKSGTVVLFLFRYFEEGRKISVLFSYDLTKECLKFICSGVISHYCWVDEETSVVWLRTPQGGCLALLKPLKDEMWGNKTKISDGHPVAIGNGIIIDSYSNLNNMQTIFKVSLPNLNKEPIAKLYNEPFKNVAFRC